AEGAKFIAPDATLSWTGGFGAKLHTVYFGDDLDTVSNAEGGLPQAATTFTPPGPLEPEKTYYWRIDEFDALATHKGNVWSFEVAKEGGGAKGDYYQGMNFENLVLTRIDPQIDFNWGNAAPDPLVGEDNFSVRWTGQVEAVFSETYTFYTNSDDGIRLWVGGTHLVNNWTNHSNTENKGTIDLVAGQTYSVVMEHYEDGGGAVAQLRWESPSTPKDLIPAAALSLLTKANTPSPRNGTVGVNLKSALTWQPGDFAGSHEVYLGTDADAVANATKASPEYQGSKALGEESFDPDKLNLDTDYFWRVDEVNNTNPDSPWAGNVWSFNTGPDLIVDDFESYNDIEPPDAASNRIFDKWIDGFGTTTNGALAGNDLPPYAELNDVHGGGQAMPYRFDNANKTSEATLTLVYPRDFTELGMTKLSLWFKGDSGNAAERMFVALNGNAVVYHDDPAVTQIGTWTEWVIDLAAFGVDLTNVDTITLGFGTKGSPAAGGTGAMLFDDIRLVK
ncbi:MAG: PA14 domain-containing protein, partial [Planctomycetota bacterium]